MPVDPSISLGVKPVEAPNILQQAMQAQIMRNQMLSGNQLQMQMGSNQAMSEAMNRNLNPDGTPNFGAANKQFASDPRAGYGAQEAYGTAGMQQGQQTQNAQSQLNLDKSHFDYLSQQLGPLVTDPNLTRNKVVAAINNASKFANIPPAILSASINSIPDDPTQLHSFVQQRFIAAQDKAIELSALTPSVGWVNNGQQQVPVNTNPNAGPVGPMAGAGAIQNQLPPESLESIETDAANNKHVVSRSPQGTILSTRPMPGSAAPGQGGFTNYTPGQSGDIDAARQEVQGIRSAADQVGVQHNINQQILNLSKDTTTAPGSDKWQKALAGFSLGNAGDNYQELGKYLEKNAIAAMQTMGGPPSDARLSAAMAANGSTQFNPGALQDVTKFNDATTTALDKYRQGMDKAVGLKNSDYTALPTFKAAWAKNLDVNVFRVENAIKNGDQAELQKIAKELGPQQMKQLAQKRLNLETLSATGRLPQ